METGHPSTRAVISGSGNQALWLATPSDAQTKDHFVSIQLGLVLLPPAVLKMAIVNAYYCSLLSCSSLLLFSFVLRYFLFEQIK